MRDRTREYAKRKTEEYRAKERISNLSPERVKRVRERKRLNHYKQKYNLTPEQLEEMKSACAGKCAICQITADLVVDHDHSTGAVRGLLCNDCNMGIGRLKDSTDILARAILYLKFVRG